MDSDFLYDERFSKRYGFWRPVTDEVVRKYLRCGDPLEWIARITSHIPRKGTKQVIYYGAYSQEWRGRESRQDIFTDSTGRRGFRLFRKRQFLMFKTQKTAVGCASEKGLGY